MSEFIPVCEPLLNGNELKYVTEAVHTGWISSSGSYVKKFEEEFSNYIGMQYGVAVCNGTVALHLAMVALGIGDGDEVIIPSFTMVSSAFAVCYTGAVPVFIDACAETWNIDVSKIEEKITNRTKAIMPVHIFGNPCDMHSIKQIADKYNLLIIEDAAEAHGAEYKGRMCGSFSEISSFSFFANKNITTGEGGMVLTNNEDLFNKCKYFKNVCFPVSGPRNYVHEDIGFNYRMSNIHAAIGLAQVERINEYKEMRMHNSALYKENLSSCPGLIFQKDTDGGVNVHWMNAIVINPKEYGHTRDELIEYLSNNGVETRLLFVSMAKQPCLKKYGCICEDKYPVTDWLSENGLYLPSSSSLKEYQIVRICNLVYSFHKS